MFMRFAGGGAASAFGSAAGAGHEAYPGAACRRVERRHGQSLGPVSGVRPMSGCSRCRG